MHYSQVLNPQLDLEEYLQGFLGVEHPLAMVQIHQSRKKIKNLVFLLNLFILLKKVQIFQVHLEVILGKTKVNILVILVLLLQM